MEEENEKNTTTFRRHLRQQYSAVAKDLQNNRQELTDPSHDVDGLAEKLQQVNKLFDNVVRARESALDANVVSDIAFMGRLKSQKICPGLSVFSSAQFMQKVLEQHGQGDKMTEESWKQLGRSTQSLYKRTPPLSFVYLDDESAGPSRRVRQPRSAAEDQPSASIVPKQVDVQRERSETSEEVELVFGKLQGYYKKWETPVDFFEFVVHPKSFGQTVENMFYVSFLLRDGFAELQLDRSGLPVLIPVVPDSKRHQLLQKDRRQLIMSLTTQEWQDIVQTFKLTKPPLIGDR